MPLHLYSDVYVSGSVPPGWVPTTGGTIKYPVRNPAVRRYLRQLLPGRWQKVIKQGNSGEVHYFGHASGQVQGWNTIRIRQAMHNSMSLKTLLAASNGMPAQQLALLALLTLGILESLANGLLSATDALREFFHTDNCLFVRRQLRDKLADAIMSHGVQLPDLFAVLPPEEAHREFQRELATIRSLCLKLLEAQRLAA